MSRRKSSTKLSDRDRRRQYALRKIYLACAVIAIGAALVVADRTGVFGRKPLPERQKYHGKTFRVVRVIDGDTIDIDIPDGKWPNTRIRFWGVDTPETVKPNTPVQHFGPEASRFVKALCEGKTVRIELEPAGKTRGMRGRLLAWVYLEDGRLLNRVLVTQGYGYADPRYDHHLKAELRRAQRKARKDGKGLWKDVTASDLPFYYQKGKHRLKMP